jgi:hypothetical protein
MVRHPVSEVNSSELTLHARSISNAVCEATPEDVQVMLETCRDL